MALPPHNLDDRTFVELVELAKSRIAERNPAWTDLSPSDPGMVLIDVFAYLTEQLLFRVNQIPEKLRVELLRLVDAAPRPPSPAVVTLRLVRSKEAEHLPLAVSLHTQFLASNGLTYTSLNEHQFAPGEDARVVAYQVEALLLDAGTTTGLPGQSIELRGGPLAQNLVRELDVVVGVELKANEPAPSHGQTISLGNSTFRLYREVETFAEPHSEICPIVVDRWQARVRFPPKMDGVRQARLQGPPPPGRVIKVWAFRTAGASGNLPLGAAFRAAQPLLGVSTVLMLEPASGGRDAEQVSEAARRAPLQVAQLRRAVTAGDYAAYALEVPGVARAHALPGAQHRPGAAPGTVDVFVVPSIEGVGDSITVDDLANPRSAILTQIRSSLDRKRVLGSHLEVNWARYQPISVRARVYVDTTVPLRDMRARLARRLQALLNPLGEWPFGQAVHRSRIYQALLGEPGVRHAEGVRLQVEAAPTERVRHIALLPWRRPGSPETQVLWIAASGRNLFQSQNQGKSWELMYTAEGRYISALAVAHGAQLTQAIALAVQNSAGAQILVSTDAGEHWKMRAVLEQLQVTAAVWVQRGSKRFLLLGTSKGLFEIDLDSDSGPKLVVVDPNSTQRGVKDLAVLDANQTYFVAVAPEGSGAVFQSQEGGASGTFQEMKVDNYGVRCVAYQRVGLRSHLWLGLATDSAEGRGCLVLDLLSARTKFEERFDAWGGGSCLSLAFAGTQVLAGTHHGGLMTLAGSGARANQWTRVNLDCGLPMENRQMGTFQEVECIAHSGGLTAVGTPSGLYTQEQLSDDSPRTFEPAAGEDNRDSVFLPASWLPCSGNHDIEVHLVPALP